MALDSSAATAPAPASAPPPAAGPAAPAAADLSLDKPVLIAGRSWSWQELSAWRSWLARNRRGERCGIDQLPAGVRAILDGAAREAPAAEPSYAGNHLGMPETPEQVLEYFCLQGFLPPQPSAFEKQRVTLIRRYGLDDPKTVQALDDLCSLARAFFPPEITVVVTAVDESTTFLAGMSRAPHDDVDWAGALEQLPASWCLCRLVLTTTGSEPFVVLDSAEDWRVRNNPLLHPESGALRFYSSVRVSLPFTAGLSTSGDAIPIGSLAAVSKYPQPEITPAQVAALQMLAKRVEREIQLGWQERQRTKARDQGAFISSFLRLTLGGSSSEEATKFSPAMAAVTSSKRQTAAFTLAAERMCSLSTAQSCAILDLRAYQPAKSGTIGGAAEHERRAKRPKVYYHPHSAHGLHNGYEGVNPLVLLGDHGVPAERLKRCSKLGKADVESFERAVRRVKEGKVDESTVNSSILANLVPADAIASRLVPIYDHNNSLALLIVLSLDHQLQDVNDIEWVKNVGHVCLSVLVKDQDVENDRSQLAFISTLSHALRTPVGALACQLELLRGSSVELNEELQVADACLDSVKSLLEDAVDFYSLHDQLDITSSTSAPELVDLSAVLYDCTTSALNRSLQLDFDSSKLEEKKVEVVVEVAARDEGWVALSSASALRRIIGNVVANAWAFTDTGSVRVVLHPVQDVVNSQHLVKLEIIDTGCGIADEFLQSGQLFVPFRRAEAYKTGAGLGLPIVASLVAQYNGQIHVTSAVGEGTTVQILLPLTLIPSPAAPAMRRTLSNEITTITRALSSAAAQQQLTSPKPLFSPATPDDSRSPSRSTSPMAAAQPLPSISPQLVNSVSPPLLPTSPPLDKPPSSSRRLRVLACEDNPLQRKLLGALIMQKGYDFTSAVDGQKGVDLFKEGSFRPDITIMDIGMPFKDGIAASHEMRAVETERGWPRHKIIAFTALSNEQDQLKALGDDGPIDDWLLKGGGTSLKVLTQELARLQLEIDANPSPPTPPA
ncbi:hypothetical protein JCM6882_002815 [Rhodosporidiobolus microsporus]